MAGESRAAAAGKSELRRASGNIETKFTAKIRIPEFFPRCRLAMICQKPKLKWSGARWGERLVW